MATRVAGVGTDAWTVEAETVTATASAWAIETSKLTKRYGDLVAVNNLDLKVRPGEVYGFLGPNGAGKTTTLRMLLGLIAPTSGTVAFNGQRLSSTAILRSVGAMIETPAFYPYLSGRDNLHLLAKYSGVPANRIDDVLKIVDLGSRGKDRFETYSLGMKQRLGVAAALLKDPPLLILDEPTNGLDPAGMADMRDLIRGLVQGKRTVLVSSHLMTEIEAICDRVGVIVKGSLVAEGTVNEMRGEESLVIHTDRPQPAAEMLRGQISGVTVRQDRDALRLTGGYVDAGAVNRLLVESGYEVMELKRERRSLESVFLSLTGEGEAHHATVR